jgi:hypothetical protein
MNQETLCVSQETTGCSDWRDMQNHLPVLAPVRVTRMVMKKRPASVGIYSCQQHCRRLILKTFKTFSKGEFVFSPTCSPFPTFRSNEALPKDALIEGFFNRLGRL